MSKDLVTVIEISDGHIKLMQAKGPRGERSLVQCEIREITAFSDDAVTKILQDMVSAKGIRPGDVIGVIPRRFAILKNLSLPSTTDDEIKRMVDLQIGNNVPYAREDVIYDSIILNRQSDGYSKVLVVVVHKEVVNRYMKIFDDAGISTNRFTLSSIGISEWFNFQKSRMKIDDTVTSAVLYIDQLNSEICFSYQSKLLFSRNINFGAKDLHSDKVKQLLEQFYMTVGTYQRENVGGEIKRVVIISALEEAQTLKDHLERDFPCPITIEKPFEGIPLAKGMNHSVFVKFPKVSVSVCVGLLLTEKEKLINLISGELIASKSSVQERKRWVKFGTVFVTTFVLAVAAFSIDIYFQLNYLNQLQKKNEGLQAEVKKAEDRINLVKYIEQKIESRLLIADIFYELYSVTPKEIAFKTVDINEDGKFSLQGYSQESSKVNEFRRKLVDAPIFKDVSLVYATKSRVFNQELTDFKINCQLYDQGNDLK